MSGLALAAIAQRGAHPLVWTTVAGLLTLTPGLYYFFGSNGRIPIVGLAPPLLIATALLIWTRPVAFDIAPFILVIGLGAAVVHYSVAACAATAAALTVFLIGASITHRIAGVAVYLSLLATALAVGYLIALERNRFLAERQARETMREHIASEERRRIAREIHDVVAHSLSITLLQLTGARRELQQDGDVEEAVRALVDAERLGRHAMADIRRTIGLLETEPTDITPEPGVVDITDLIHDFETAGLVLNYRIDRDYHRVSPSTGLGIYRICEESLANVVKHAPGAKAHMDLQISPSTISLSISNDIPKPAPGTVRDTNGDTGLRRMKQRAQLLGGSLSAGPEGGRWTVKAQIPLSDREPPSAE
ncbi:MAG: two-component sensor histidine kinase [Mycobacterium sp.]|nr:two-component sensor histidine kinase [Mycobacterium sp.]